MLPQIAPSAPSSSTLLRSDWNLGAVATTGMRKVHTKTQPNNRPGSKESFGNGKKKGLPPLYSKWLVKYWLYSNRKQTCPVDHVNLSGWPIDKTVAGCVSTICKKSLSLILNKSPGVTDQILNRLSFLARITLLDVTGCTEITDVGVNIIRRHFPKLQTLSMAKCNQITRLSVSPLIKTFKNIRNYNFSGCTELTDAVMESLAYRASRPDEYVELEQLNISQCFKLTAAGLGPFLHQCQTLIEFRLRDCSGMEGIGFAPLQEKRQPHLLVLDIGNMSQIQDVDFAWICQGECFVSHVSCVMCVLVLWAML